MIGVGGGIGVGDAETLTGTIEGLVLAVVDTGEVSVLELANAVKPIRIKTNTTAPSSNFIPNGSSLII
jgi:hypothetical protein